MNKYTLMFAAAMLSALPALSDVQAQTKSQSTSPGGQAAEKPFVTEQMALETPTGTLHGTLERPQSPSPVVPVALIIAGSGPTDRDGNSAMLKGANNSLKLLAAGLAAQGIASLRYDKRGIAASAGKGMLNEADLSFETYINDAILWGRKLRAPTAASPP